MYQPDPSKPHKFPAAPNRFAIMRTDSGGKNPQYFAVGSDLVSATATAATGTPDLPAYPTDTGFLFDGSQMLAVNEKNAAPAKSQFYVGGGFNFTPPTIGSSPIANGFYQEFEGADFSTYYYQACTREFNATGWGDPAFASYYPNCRQVFGLTDSTSTDKTDKTDKTDSFDASTEYTYTILGWYQTYTGATETQQDILSWFQNASEFTDQFGSIESTFRWNVSDKDAEKAFPSASVFYSQIVLIPKCVSAVDSAFSSAKGVAPKPPKASLSSITLGESGSGAYAADLANLVATDNAMSADASEIEDTLKAINLNGKLGQEMVDLDFQERDELHSAEFSSVSAGTVWTVESRTTAKSGDNTSAPISSADFASYFTSPVADELNQLNLLQREYDRATDEIESMQRQLFTEWANVMNLVYPSPATGSELQPLPNILYYLGIWPIVFQVLATGELETITKASSTKTGLTVDEWKASYTDETTFETLFDEINWISIALTPDGTLSGKPPSDPPLSVQVILQLQKVVTAVNAATASSNATTNQVQFSLIAKPAAPYLKPKNPVILLNGGDAVATDPELPDTPLVCQIASISTDLPWSPPADVPSSPVEGALDTLFGTWAKNITPSDPGYSNPSTTPWNPFSFDWSAGFNPIPSSQSQIVFDTALSFDLPTTAVHLTPFSGVTVASSSNYHIKLTLTNDNGTLFSDDLLKVVELRLVSNFTLANNLAPWGDASNWSLTASTTDAIASFYLLALKPVELSERYGALLLTISAPCTASAAPAQLTLTAALNTVNEVSFTGSVDKAANMQFFGTNITGLARTLTPASESYPTSVVSNQGTSQLGNFYLIEGLLTDDFITANYNLTDTAEDLVLSTTLSGNAGDAYGNSALVSGHAPKQLLSSLAPYLAAMSLYDLYHDSFSPSSNNPTLDELKTLATNVAALMEKLELSYDPNHIDQTPINTGKAIWKTTAKSTQEYLAWLEGLVTWARQQGIFSNYGTAANSTGDVFTYNPNYSKPNKPGGWSQNSNFTLDAVVAWYLTLPIDTSPYTSTRIASASDPIWIALKAYAQAQSQNDQVIAQTLNGFDGVLRGLSQNYQHPVQDPGSILRTSDGNSDYSPGPQIGTDVAVAIQQRNYATSNESANYLPIRNGVFQLKRLTLLDSFGQQKSVKLSSLSLTDTLDPSIDPVTNKAWSGASPYSNVDTGSIRLSPRINQPTQLGFNWISADGSDAVELSRSPLATPICGWIVPNNLSGSLAFYDQTGGALGSVDQNGDWQSAPDSNVSTGLINIPDPHLRNIAKWLTGISATPSTLAQDFRSVLDSALENINPKSFAQHESLALLMGRPIAVARVQLDLRVKGLLDVNQSSTAFSSLFSKVIPLQSAAANTQLGAKRDDFVRARITNGMENVQFPIRIGEFKQLDDGVVGYWVEDNSIFSDNMFYAPQSTSTITNTYISNQQTGDLPPLSQSIDDQPLNLTLLLDPRASVHASTGILPAHKLTIPSNQYADTLKRLSVTFLTSPILNGSRTGMALPLPNEPGYQWSWLDRANSQQWLEASELTDVSEKASFDYQNQLIEGWLKLKPSKPK